MHMSDISMSTCPSDLPSDTRWFWV